jgi:hypothetical protein
MEAVERLQAIEAWVAWLRAELEREVCELIAVVASQSLAVTSGASWVSCALAVRTGRQLITQRIGPLLAELDEMGRQLRFAQAEAMGVSR